MIVAGHVADPRNKPNTVGAKSYRGVDEYQFNDELLALFSESKNQIRGVNYHLLFATENVELRARSRLANTRLPTLYLEIHHDAARRIDREKATAAGVDSALWNPIQGFSVHYSTDSEEAILSRRFARLLGKTMAESGFIPNQYLANIVRMKIEDREIGLYNRVRPHGLYIFRAIKVPVVVLEAGNIAHPREETRLSEEYTRLKVVESINQAIIRYLSGE
ncbi:MAG: N-acetylmuramoyl-L-alanine amidase [Acidiferrobacterales bacterium]|nr:N-acetylmuramoyl-L-alanine amidase [Acidiferrobacterales bacterium]